MNVDHPMQHGGDLSEAVSAHGGALADWLDLSTGINPHAYPLSDIASRFWRALPTRGDLDDLLEMGRVAYGLPADVDLVAAPGTQALIQWLPRLAPEGAVAVLGPTYHEHALACRAAGREVREIRTLEAWREPSLVVVNPNNPDGRLLDLAHLRALAATASDRGGWLVIDEAFIDVMPEASAATLCTRGPVVILRSFGKFYGLAGVRLGFALASRPIAGRLRLALGPWAVAGPALAIGAAALGDQAWTSAMRTRLAHEASALDAILGTSCAVIGGTALYRLARHREATRLHAHLASSHIWVRRFGWDETLLRFGLPPDDGALARLDRALRAFDAGHASPQGITAVSPTCSGRNAVTP